jgi:tetratricopeptide (TPR) repeat protein
MEYLDQGLQPAISRLSELKNHRENRYHFAPSELLMLCRRMIEAGRVHDSDLFYQALQETLEEDYRIQRGYGMICVMQGLVDKGLALLQESMSDFPVEFMETVYSLGSDLLLKSKTEDALKVMTFNAGHFPDHPMPHYGLARAYQQIGDTERMMMCCEKALEINPDYEPAANLFKLVHK